MKRISFWTLLALQIAAIFLGRSLAKADRFEVDVPARGYLYGMSDWKPQNDKCSAASGSLILCETQRSQVSDPFYVGVGLGLIERERWRLGFEADVDPELSGEYRVVPQTESSRGVSLKGSFLFRL